MKIIREQLTLFAVLGAIVVFTVAFMLGFSVGCSVTKAKVEPPAVQHK